MHSEVETFGGVRKVRGEYAPPRCCSAFNAPFASAQTADGEDDQTQGPGSARPPLVSFTYHVRPANCSVCGDVTAAQAPCSAAAAMTAKTKSMVATRTKGRYNAYNTR